MRRSGKTTEQLRELTDGAIFVCHESPGYVYDLCAKIGGTVDQSQGVWTKLDGSVVRIFQQRRLLRFNQMHLLMSYEFKSLVADHRLLWDDEAARCFYKIKSWIR